MPAAAIVSRAYFEHFGAVPNPQTYVDTPVKKRSDGSVQCAELVKQLAGAPMTQPDNWKKGTALTAKVVGSLMAGTPIAAGWNAENFYPNNSSGQHSGLFGKPVLEKGVVVGFTIIEQYRGLKNIAERVVYFDPASRKIKDDYFHNGSDYATIQW
ncbi:BPSL0067 family protein [Roseateles sp. SL47]|uniref:BPSL0067 family protein n=1 Tax=Roseateles sp. SL47 TaxID=2995138 RepID=UPI002271375D|nr:BPSL0067 family protein [Roseateles sp. SL47]WAC72239.1 BPSL0067 family protein [Roseateles sp. SL47]